MPHHFSLLYVLIIMIKARCLVVVLFVCLLMSAAATMLGGEGTMTFTLERAFPTSHPVDMSELKEQDRARHSRILSSSGRVDFPLQGTSDPLVAGLYFTRIQLGSPPKEFYVLVDTGSDALWVNCAFCDSCPSRSGLQIPLHYYDPMNSTTSSVMSCSDRRCKDGCYATNHKCNYTLEYGDNSTTSGYIVEDFVHFDTIKGNAKTTSTSCNVFFGCSTSRKGYTLVMPTRAFDGILGLGQNKISVISQLASHGLVPSAFSHCLKGSGGGILVLGQVLEPKIVYTPIVPSKMHYNVDLQSIFVNGQLLPINAQAFRETFIDSGTTYAYLADDAYDPFINAITQVVSASTSPLVFTGRQCYISNSSVDIFPIVTLKFAGGASMVLNPKDYMVAQFYNIYGGKVMWCIGFQKHKSPYQGLTILGELVLKDKIIVYDLANQRIGWKTYDCSKPIKASTAAKKKISSLNNQFYGFLVTWACIWFLLSF